MTDPFDLAAALRHRRDTGRYRQRLEQQAPCGREALVAGRRLLNFSGNDYLGLAAHPQVIEAFKRAADEFGVGSGASHLVCGHSRYHHALEERLAEFCRCPRALLFSTGYMANQGVLCALLGKEDAVFEDRLNHASLIDGGLASGARFQRYRHNDSNSLEGYLGRSQARRKLVVTDGVFSMDGDIAPLPALAAVARRNGAWLMVDDAHGLGVLGATGRGSLEQTGSRSDVQVLMGTLGKAFGTSGAFVAGSEELIETLIQQARTYIYTTALPPAVAAATLASLKLVQEESWRRDKLAALIRRFRAGAARLGLTLMDSATPIQPLVVGTDEAAVAASEALRERGALAIAIRAPTVPAGSARLRITFSASHEERDVDLLLDALEATRTLMGGDN